MKRLARHGFLLPLLAAACADPVGSGRQSGGEPDSTDGTDGGTGDDGGAGDSEGGTDGGPNLDWIHVDGACSLDADCGPGVGCVLGRCTQGCEADDECEGGDICDLHGSCVAPGLTSPTAPQRVPSNAVTLEAGDTEVDPTTGESWAVLRNASDQEIHYRMVTLGEGITASDAVRTLGPGEETYLYAVVDLAQVPPAVHERSVDVVTDAGTLPWTLLLPDDPDGRYRGRVGFGVSHPLGMADLGLSLVFESDGEVWGRVHAEDSLAWPTDVSVEGQWDPGSGRMTLRVYDVLPAAVEDSKVQNPFERPIGRELVLHGEVDGTGIEGEVDLFLYGLVERTVASHGTFRLGRGGAANVVGSEVVDMKADALAVSPGPAFLDTADACEGLGETFGTAESVGPAAHSCLACAGGSCSAARARTCAEALGEHGYDLEERITLGEITVESTLASKVPEAWIECTQGAPDDPFPCLDPAALRCATALGRVAFAASGDDWDRLVYLDALDRFTTANSMLGAGDRVDAGLAHLSTVLGSPAEAELFSLGRARDRFAEPLRQFNAPGFLQVLSQLGSAQVAARGGRDLTNGLTLVQQTTDTLRSELRLRRRTEPANREALRGEVRLAAAWTLAQGIYTAHLLDTFGVVDELGELAVFGESMAAYADLARELEPGTNPLGFRPSFVPMLLSSADGAGATNFELVREHARPNVRMFEDREVRAIAALEKFETAQYQALDQYATVEEQYDSRLVSLCGPDPFDPAKPDLETCGQHGGEIQSVLGVLETADLNTSRAMERMRAAETAIAVEEDRIAEVILNAQELDATIAELQDGIWKVKQEERIARAVIRENAAKGECSRARKRADRQAVEIGLSNTLQLTMLDATAGIAGAPMALFGLTWAQLTHVYQEADTACAAAKEAAGLEGMESASHDREQDELVVVNQEIDAAIRASSLAEKVLNSEAVVRTRRAELHELSLAIEQTHLEARQAVQRVASIYNQAGSILTRRERAKARLRTNPDNPYLNPSFLVLRNELGEGLSGLREEALRWMYRTGRALEFEINRDVPAIETRLYPARSSHELGEFETCLGNVYTRYLERFGAPQQHVVEISLREQVFGIVDEVFDPVTGDVVTKAEQFAAALADPALQLDDGTIGIRFALTLDRDGPLGRLTCDARIEAMEVRMVGDYLGDGHAEVLVENAGRSSARRCDAADLPRPESVNDYDLGTRRVVIQAGVNDWGDATPNRGFAGWPVAGEQWVVTVPTGADAPANEDLDPTELSDIVLRITHQAGTVDAAGQHDLHTGC